MLECVALQSTVADAHEKSLMTLFFLIQLLFASVTTQRQTTHAKAGSVTKKHTHNRRPPPRTRPTLAAPAPRSPLLVGDRHHLAKHHCGVAIQKRNAGQTLTVFERVHHQWLLGLKHNLSHFIGLECVRGLELLATSLLAHLPVDLLDAACRATAAHKANGGVSCLDLTGDVQGLDLGGEGGHGLEGGVGLEDHHVTGTGHVVLCGFGGEGVCIIVWRNGNTLVVCHKQEKQAGTQSK